ncbi:hypothetical protein [Cellulomonas fimi]|uniref:Tetratricopeptide repeat protein n=1 Tax=Cellulomonas fimi (strain ATCC 484 / DSM 20113 / JCM 1341 / CCUG 24087 / LMG 16345 / NBRC 15513 / NCIMB 8980 / NCTC 7547 / NRS-133) TaxID=590998 RepID=F4H4Q8_CELFA|nr:hypothetical protein [Cellulomonas fimi]AEE44259.1 hypothetical protein Celf_0109 [Cellulomonas fimi ATCC 484]NNH05706.1 hypothetical protein [Cellulomonas fimi]VEH25988.1 Uncharacterised protein [Cellulomonas fimi]
MSRTLDEVNCELMRIREMPYGLARTQAAERQVRLVEAEGPDAARAFALSVLVDSMYWAGEVEKSYLPFTLLVRWWDEHPELFDEIDRHSLFWYFKWMVNDLADYPTVPVAQIEATLDDMERRYALAGHGRDAVAYSRFCWAAARGADDVERLFQEWVATPRDEFSQCEVCDPGDRASHLRATGRLEETVRLVEQTLAEGATCATEPADMLSHLALAYLDLGRPQDAARAHRRAVATLAESKGEMAGARGRRIVLLGRGGQPERAVRAIEEDARLLLAAETPAARLGLLVDVVEATAAMLPTHGDLPVRAAGVPAATVAELHAWAVAEAAPLAAAFDRRNGTTRESDLLAIARAARPAPTPLDLDLGLLDPTRAPAGGAADAAATGAPTVDDAPVDDLAAAESALAAGRTEEAAQAYARAAAGAQDAGRIVDAGYAWAESARCAQVLADDATAHVLYARSVALLRAGGVEPQDVAPVVVAWAPAAATSGHADALVETADALVEALTGAAGDDVAPEGVALAQRKETERRRAAADLDDAAARVLASVADAAGPADRAVAEDGSLVERAVTRAARAAEAYASVGALGDAAHAFWLAGRLLDGQGRTQDAVWHLESAVEGFGLAHDRQTRARAADDLVALLRRTGQDARAEEVLAALSR